MLTAHRTLAVALLLSCVLAALAGGVAYRRRRGAHPAVAHLLALAQTLLAAQVGVGLLLLADDRRAADGMHYMYGSLALGAALVPWFYAPAAGPRRLLWFSGLTALAAVLGVRATMTGA